MRKEARRATSFVELIVAIGIVAVLVGLLLPAVSRVREAASRHACSNSFRQIGLASEFHREASGRLPGTCENDNSPKSWPWTIHVANGLEQDRIAEGFDPMQPISAPRNSVIGRARVPQFRCRGETDAFDESGLVIGNAFANLAATGLRLEAVQDGASNTAFAFECSNEWQGAWLAGPVRMVLVPEDSPHRTSTPLLFCDGSVRLIQMETSSTIREALMSPAGGEPVSIP